MAGKKRRRPSVHHGDFDPTQHPRMPRGAGDESGEFVHADAAAGAAGDWAHRVSAQISPARGAAARAGLAPDNTAAEVVSLRRQAETSRQLGDMRVANNPKGSYHHTRGLA